MCNKSKSEKKESEIESDRERERQREKLIEKRGCRFWNALSCKYSHLDRSDGLTHTSDLRLRRARGQIL